MKAYLRCALLLALAPACVSSGKYDDAMKKLKQCQTDHDACVKKDQDDVATADDLKKQLETVTKDRDDQKDKREQAEEALADKQKACDEQVGTMQGNLDATKKELEELRKQHEQAQKRLQAYRDLSAKFQKMVDAGKLKVLFRKGRMELKLPAGILFASGKADLSDDGKTALADVAAVLKGFGDRSFVVAGFTDNVPLRGSKFKDNWELSSARAVTVTKYLVDQGVPPQNLSAAGYGEFDPIGDNETDEGRAENRRIEIIVMPTLEELPSLDDDGSDASSTSSSGS